MDLIREILLEVERHPPERRENLTIPEREFPELGYHVELLLEAGLLEGRMLRHSMGTYGYQIERLTWAGHDWLDAARHDTVWREAREQVKKKGGEMPFAIFTTLLTEIAKRFLLSP